MELPYLLEDESDLPADIPVGSWTAFMKAVTDSGTQEASLEYLEAVPLPPNDTICRYYLNLMLQMADEMKVDCILAHSDEVIFSKIVLTQWLHQGKYDKIVNIMGGSHTLLVNLKVLDQKYAALGLSELWVHSGSIVEGSLAQAAEGRSYFRSVHLHKQSFEALLHYRIKNHVDKKKFSPVF